MSDEVYFVDPVLGGFGHQGSILSEGQKVAGESPATRKTTLTTRPVTNLRLLACWCKNLFMNRLWIGVLCGVVFGIVDVLMTVFGKHLDMTRTMLLQAFSSRFAIGVLAATVTLPVHPILAGAIVGVLISLPDAFGLHSYAGVLGTGLLFGALTAWTARKWGS